MPYGKYVPPVLGDPSRVGRSLPYREIPRVSGSLAASRRGIPPRSGSPSTVGISLHGRYVFFHTSLASLKYYPISLELDQIPLGMDAPLKREDNACRLMNRHTALPNACWPSSATHRCHAKRHKPSRLTINDGLNAALSITEKGNYVTRWGRSWRSECGPGQKSLMSQLFLCVAVSRECSPIPWNLLECAQLVNSSIGRRFAFKNGVI